MGERDYPLAPGRRLAGGQAPSAALAPGEPAARPLPDLGRGGVLLPRDEVAARRPPAPSVTTSPATGTRPLVHRRILEGRAAPAAPLDELRQHPVVAVDVNVAHLAVAVVAADGNVLGTPAAIPLDLAGLPAATRDGRLRAAISSLIATAKKHAPRRS